PPRPSSTLFPYTTLFRSAVVGVQIHIRLLLQRVGVTQQRLVRTFQFDGQLRQVDVRRAALLQQQLDQRRGHAQVAGADHQLEPRSEEHTSELQSRENLVC